MAKTATKKAVKKTVTKKAVKKTVTKKAVTTARKSRTITDNEIKDLKKNIFDNRLSDKEKKQRDKMLSALVDTDNEDLQHIIEVFNNANELQQENMKKHYEINGSLFINAIFTGNLQLAQLQASENDKDLLNAL